MTRNDSSSSLVRSTLALFVMTTATFGVAPGCASDTTDDGSGSAPSGNAAPGSSGGSGSGSGVGPTSGNGSGGGSGGGASSGNGSGGSKGNGGSGGADAGHTDAGSSSGGSPSGTGGVFTASEPWNTRVDSDPKAASSDAIIHALSGAGGWGTTIFQMDMSIEVLHADASTPMKTFTPTGDFYSPDCDQVPFPVPATGAIEGETGYACTQDGDCHLLVVHEPTKKLYEMWRANIDSTGFHGGCTAVWDLTKAYPASLRGDGCTSADAGGFPITAMLANADEAFAGEVKHALRFILPNARIRHDVFVHPGTHTTSATSGGADAPPYGVRFRLRADYPLASLPSAGARTLAVALQRYGMFLADGGNVPLTVQSDRFTTHKWSDVGVDERALSALQVSDFEVVDMATPVTSNPDCTRN
jgi:serine/threonine-protein kinase